jgi:hypothetical protein
MQRETLLREQEASLQRREEELKRKEAQLLRNMANLHQPLLDNNVHVNVAKKQYLDNSTQHVKPHKDEVLVMLPSALSSSMSDIMTMTKFLSTQVGFVIVNLFFVFLCMCLSFNHLIFGKHHKNSIKEVEGAEAIHKKMMHRSWLKDDTLASFIDESMVIERHRDVTYTSMFMNRPWHAEPGPPVVVKNPGPNKEWRDGELWPGGGKPPEHGFPRLYHFRVHFWNFLFAYKKPYFSLGMMVLCGVIPPMETIVFSWIADGIGPNGDIRRLLVYLMLLCVLHFANDRAYYAYEIDVPLASVRWELRHRILRQFLAMRGDLADTWTTGRALGVMDHDVHAAVNCVWKAIFQVTRHLSTVIALFMATVWMNRTKLHVIKWPILIVFVSLIGVTAAIVTGRHHTILDLAKRKRDWRLGWMSIASKLIDDARDGRLNRSLDDAQLEFGKAAFLYRSRAFHSYFGSLTASMCMSQMVLLSKCLLAFYACALAIEGKLSTGQALALLKIGDLMSKTLTGMVKVSLQIHTGYVSLVELAEVFNADVV